VKSTRGIKWIGLVRNKKFALQEAVMTTCRACFQPLLGHTAKSKQAGLGSNCYLRKTK